MYLVTLLSDAGEPVSRRQLEELGLKTALVFKIRKPVTLGSVRVRDRHSGKLLFTYQLPVVHAHKTDQLTVNLSLTLS